MFFKKGRIFLLTTLLAFWSALSLAAVEVNTATQAELDSVKGLGPATSQKIIAEREKAPFKDWADFQKRVKGMQDKKSTALSQAGLTVNGAEFGGTHPMGQPTNGAAGQPSRPVDGAPLPQMPSPRPDGSNLR
jgi:competence protein ComEA